MDCYDFLPRPTPFTSRLLKEVSSLPQYEAKKERKENKVSFGCLPGR